MRGRQLYCAYYIQAMVCVNDLYPFKLNFLCTYVQVVEKAFSWRYHLRNEMAGKGVIYSMWLSRSSWTLALMSSCGKKTKQCAHYSHPVAFLKPHPHDFIKV